MQQQTSKSLKELRQFLQNISTSSQPDPYWQSILQSDIRNIIPKHEVCKIELVKNSLSQIRLIMQNLNTFISLQIQKKHLKQQMIDLNENITKQLQEVKDQHKNVPDAHFHYDIHLSAKRKQIQLFAKEIVKPKTSSELKTLLKNSHKWHAYIQKNMKELQKVKEQQVHEDIVNFISTYEGLFSLSQNSQNSRILLPNHHTLDEIILKSGSYTKMYEYKLQDRILIQKLVDDVFDDASQEKLQDVDDESHVSSYWRNEVRKLRQLHDV